MPGINTTGAPNTRDYVLGRGVIRFALIDNATGLPDANGFRDLGNSPEFTITVDTEDLRHQNSRDCIKFTDKRFVVSQEVGLGFQLDETRNFENLSDFFSGSTSTYDNPHDATHADATVTTAVKKGRWYEMRKASGARVYNLDATGLVYTIERDIAGVDTLLVEGTDYEIDEQLGLIRILPTSVTVTEGQLIQWSITTAASGANIQDLDQVNALQRSEVTGALLFVQDNAGDCGQKVEWRFHKVSLTSDGDLAMIGDEVATMNFTGVAEVNSLITDASQVLTIRTYDMI